MKQSLLILTLITLVGCGVKRPFEGRADPHPPSQVNFASQILEDSTAVGHIVAMRDAENDILHVTVPIRSTINQQLYIDYRVTFFDRNGQQLTNTGWFTRLLTPNVQDQIQVRSTTPQAADFRIDFRDAR